MDVLQSKHPDSRVPDTSVMEEYDTLPDLVETDVTEEVVEKVAQQLTGSDGSGGTDFAALHQWLLRFRGASQQQSLKGPAEHMSWMAQKTEWAAYRAL